MSNYTKTTNFAAKDSLPSGNANKIVKGTEIDTEFDNIATASATKADIAGPTFTGTVTIPTVDLNGGAIDGTTVGASTAAAITGTTIVANTSINIAGDGATVTGIKDEDDMSSNSATKLATQQSIKAYVDSQVTAQDLDFQADSGGALSIDLDSETLTFTGGTGVDTSGSGNAVTFAIDSTVATLTGTQTLTNKTLTSPTLNTPTIGTSFTIGSATITEAELEILDGATVTTAELNVLDGITSTTAELNILDGVTSTAAELNILDGVTATTAEINYVDGVTSNVQTQLDAKAPIASPTFTGTVTVPGLTTSADILFGDNDKAIFGAGSDLEIYHSGTGSYITDSGTGALYLQGQNLLLQNNDGSKVYLSGIGDVATLYYGTGTKLATTSTGIDVTGVITTDGMTTSADINFGDNDKAIFGAGSDLQIYHDGTNSRIQDAGSGNLKLVTDGAAIQLQSATENMVVATPDADVQLYYNGLQKLATTSTGLDVTGNISLPDNGKAIFGAGSDLQIYHDGSASYIDDAGTGNLRIRANSSLSIQKYTGETMGVFTADGSVLLAHDNATKFETTSTGIDVTGTVTTDGLTVSTSGNQTVLVESTGGTSSLQFRTSSGSISNYIRSGTGGSAVLQFMTAGENERMRIDTSGNVLVGQSSTTTPGIGNTTLGTAILAGGLAAFSRAGGAANATLYVNKNTDDGPLVRFSKNGTEVGNIGTNSGNIYLSDGARSLIVDGDTVKAGYSTGGNADGAQDLGTSSVRWRNLYLSGISYSNTVYSDLNLTLAADYNNDSSTGNSNILFQTDGTERARIYSDGSLLVGKTGIGNSLAGLRLLNATGNQGVLYITKTVSGNKNAIINYHNATYVGGVNYSDTATSFQTSSDQRLKENIADADDAGSKVDSIQVRKFDWKVDGSHQDYGMIAQELQAVAPEAVSAPEDPDEMMGVDYSKLVPMLVKEIQSLRNRVAQLENN